MNRVFKVIWNHCQQRFVVTSELARNNSCISQNNPDVACLIENKGRITLFQISPLMVALFSIFGMTDSVMAADIQVHDFTPQDKYEEVISGTGNNLTGSFSGIQRGEEGYRWTTLGQAKADGIITGESAQWVDHDIFRMGSQTKVINYVDPITGNQTSMKVYDNSDMQTEPAKDFRVVVSTPVGADGQYVDRNFYQIGSGSALDVSVGKDSANWVGDDNNRFSAILKSSSATENRASVFHVTGDSGAAALNYDTKTVVVLGNQNNNIRDQGNALAYMTAADFVGKFDSVIGEQNVTSVEEFKAYNDGLIKAIESGQVQLTEKEYSDELNKARDNALHSIYADTSSIGSDDALRAQTNRDAVAYIHAKGEQASVTINNDANIQMVNSDASVVNLENGATLVNNGTLGTAGNTYRGAYVVTARSGSRVENNGVIDAGTNPEMASFFQAGSSEVAAGAHIAVLANGNSVVNNNAAGVINLASRSHYYGNTGILMSGDATLNNAGAINIAASEEAASILGSGSNIGAVVQGNTTFNNRGTLYIGRMAQRAPGDASQDLAIKQGSIGVQLYGNGIYNGEAGSRIVIGSLVQNATAIDVGGAAQLAQNGTIEINGAVAGQEVATNTGILVREGTSAAKVVNSGTIDLNGLNSIGIKVLANGQATNSGTINVKGGLDPISHYASYGIYAEGEGAQAVLSGKVNLSGDGAIGVHARLKGEISVTGSGEVAFVSGARQTGYYIYGAGSSIKNTASGEQDVTTTDSTLYRVDGGAAFDGGVTDAAQLNASGTGATIVRTTGQGSTFNSGKMALSVTGTGATGIRIEGGAQGEIGADAVIVRIDGQNTTAGIVDGDYYDLDGSVNEAKHGDSVLTSYATLETSNTANGAFGYIARNGGTLIHQGNIDFTATDSTGVLVDGGTLDNRSTIDVNGTAVNIQGADSRVTNSGTVTATDGTAAYLVGKDASLTLTGSGETRAAGSAHGILLDQGASGLSVEGATISMDNAGSGSAIENRAALAGIQLKETTINVGNGIGVHTGASMAQTNSGTINVSGSGTGILFENIDGSRTDEVLDMRDSRDLVINVQQADGKGIVTNASSDLDTGASVNVLDSNGGAALIVGGTTQRVGQYGNLTSVSQNSPVVDVNNGALTSFTNYGTIQADSREQVALDNHTGSGIQFTNASGGAITGQVNLLSGDNQVTLVSGSTGNDFTTGNGDDRFLLKDIQDGETGLFSSLNGGQGDDTLTLQNSRYVLDNADAVTGMEHIELTDGSEFTLDNVTLALGDAQDDGAGTGYQLDGGSTLALRQQADTAFNSHLAGTGTVAADTAGHRFDFTANNASDGFNGTLALTNSRFELDGLNTRALSQATLSAGSGSLTHVGVGEQNIGGLAFNGGTVSFDGVTPGEAQAAGVIHAREIDLSGRGNVQVDTGIVSNDRPAPNDRLSLLEQDDDNALIRLATSDSAVQGGAGNLTLLGADGNPINDAVTVDIAQNGETVARGTWDYRLTSGSGDGLYINYGLTQVELLGSGDSALTLDAAGNTGNSADLSARVTGSGDLALDSLPGQTVSLSNMDNDYTGVTDVRGGNLLMQNNNVLGNTQELRLATETGLDMNGHSQSIGVLNGDEGSLLNLNGGSLTLENGGNSAGELSGTGTLTLAGGTLTVKGANTALNAETTIADGARALLDNASGLGRGDIQLDGELQLNGAEGAMANALSGAGELALMGSTIALVGDNRDFAGNIDIDGDSQLQVALAQHIGHAEIQDEGSLVVASASDWTLDNRVSGAGDFYKQGGGTVTLTDAAQWRGVTEIEQGGLTLGQAERPVTLASQQVNIREQGILSGFGGVAGNIDNAGELRLGNGVQSPAGSFNVGGNLVNSGDVTFGVASQAPGNQLVVQGNYQGADGRLNFNTVLGGDDSLTDRLVVKGDTEGQSSVRVTNAGGSGAQTLNGIELIHVDGKSNGEFTQQGRIAAGAWDYTLARGESGNSGNWYLTSHASGTDPDNPDGGDDNRRPEGGSYTANLAAANTLFVTTLHDRLGETNYVDALSGEQRVTSMWMRHVGGHKRWHDGSGQLATQENRYVMQLGGDIAQWSRDGGDRGHLGLMAGYANSHSSTHSSRTGHGAKGSVDGYSVGIYGTWFANEQDKSGLYIDSWLQYNWFRNQVNGDDLPAESYRSKGFSASLESGYSFRLGEYQGSEGTPTEWFIQPQAQAVWMGVKADDHNEANGTRIQGKGDGNLMTRLGVRTFLKGHHQRDDGKERTFEPFVEANWIHNTRNFAAVMNGVTTHQDGARNIGEIKVGVEGQVSPRLNLWGNVGVQVGDKGYNDNVATLGIKYNF